jgi:hypothetical protein
MLNFSTDHANIEQLLVEALLALPLSQDELIAVLCDKEELCANDSFIPMPQLGHINDTYAFEPYTYAVFISITCAHDEQQLLSSLNTLGYIEFDILCILNCLEERLFAYPELPCLTRNTYHFIGKYNHKGKYMVHRLYICSNLKSSLVGQ